MTWQNDLLQSALAEFPPSRRPRRSAPAATAERDEYESADTWGDCPAYAPQKPMTRPVRVRHFALVLAAALVPALVMAVVGVSRWMWLDGWR